MNDRRFSDVDIKIFAVIGLVGLLAMISLPFVGLLYVNKEAVRMRECQTRSPKDPNCTPSWVWGPLQALDQASD